MACQALPDDFISRRGYSALLALRLHGRRGGGHPELVSQRSSRIRRPAWQVRFPTSSASRRFATDHETVRISVRGELDVETAPALEELLSREMAAKRAVVLDFAETSFMDSNGLTVLVRAINDAKVNGWNISVASTINAGW